MIIPDSNSASGSYTIDNSIMMDIEANRVKRTLGTPTSAKKGTYSTWIKRSEIDPNLGFMQFGNDASGDYLITRCVRSQYNGRWVVRGEISGVDSEYFQAHAVMIDPALWYHWVIAVDTTQSTAADRMKVYVNGHLFTASETVTDNRSNITQNADLGWWASGKEVIVGEGVYDWSGYIAETYFIDGQQLDATDFGKYDSDSGIWVPKAYTGTYGNNGFFLEFKNTSNFGEDSSPNNHTFTVDNMDSSHSSTDTPTNSFATFNVMSNTNATYGATAYVGSGIAHGATHWQDADTNTWSSNISTLGVKNGKWYAEFSNIGSECMVGVTIQENNGYYLNNYMGQRSDTEHPGIAYYGTNGYKYYNATSATYGSTYTTTDVIGVALDMDNGYVYFSKNGTWQNSGDPTSGATGTGGLAIPTSLRASMNAWGIGVSKYNNDKLVKANWGGLPGFTISSGNADANGYGNFEYAPPSGYYAMCTKNIAEFDPPAVDDPSAYFQISKWSATGSTQSITHDGNSDMQPDFVWIKQTSGTENNIYFDSTRGVEKGLKTDSNASETTYNSSLTSFNSDGFTLGTSNAVNGSGSFVSWAWKANGGTTSTNSDGDIDSLVQVNTDAGFSIVRYNPSNTTSRNIGHGLGEVPGMIWVRNRSKLEDTICWLRSEGNGGWRINSNASYNSATSTLVNGATSTTFNVGSDLSVNGNYTALGFIAYCFVEKQGYSKFGMYHGNGEIDDHGPFIYTGFKPAFVLVKYASSSAWAIVLDDERPGYNKYDTSNRSFPGLAQAESTSQDIITMLSTGFQIRSTDLDYNTENGRYLYWAFAKHPMVTSSGVPMTGSWR